MGSTRTTPVLLFDGDCGFCTTSVRWAERVVRPDAEVRAWQLLAPAELAELDDGRGLVTPERLEREVVWVTPVGAVYGGAAAAAKVLARGGGFWAVLGAVMQVPGGRVLADRLYRWVAANRYLLPGGTPACAVGQGTGRVAP